MRKKKCTEMQFQVPILVVCIFVLCFDGARATTPRCPAMFVFADSLSDTGNGPLTNPLFLRSTMLPYGETEPGKPDGRFSDGYLIIDYVATFLGLPLLRPYLDTKADFSLGVNYAVAGATALNVATLARHTVFPLTSKSLEVQLGWHEAFKASIPPSGGQGKPNAAAFSRGLYVLEIGGNDYIDAFTSQYTPAQVITTFIPLVVQTIQEVTEILYSGGARNFLIFSITPLGCSPSVLAQYSGPRDSNGCLTDYNSVAINHGVSLHNLVRNLRVTHPDAKFVFADYFGAFSQVLANAKDYGITNTLDSCCGAPPPVPYRFSLETLCNSSSTTLSLTLCSDPNAYINWDGLHYTDNCNHNVASLFTSGSYLEPPNGLAC